MKRFGIWPGLILAGGLAGCDDAPPADADASLGGACLQGDLVAQCPPGSNPLLGATAEGLCAGGAELRNMQGHVTGRCYGEGACVVACQFAAACPCGVESITRDGVFCTPCPDVNPCGDGMCAAGENPQSCPQDCAGECVPMELRCQGDALESCNLRGRWEALACPRGEVCTHPEGGVPQCDREDIIVGRDGGVGDAGGPRISGRLLLGDADYPGSGIAVRPGAGRDLTYQSHFGVLRFCRGNDVLVANCRTAISTHPRDELVNPEGPSEVLVSAEADHVRLWGTHRVLAFGFDGGGPPFGERPALEAFCPHHATHCLGQPDACAEAVPPDIQTAYDSWTYGHPAMRCWLNDSMCGVGEPCLSIGRTFGYDEGRRIARPDAGALSADGRAFAFWIDERQVGLYDVETEQVTVVGNVGSYFGPGHRNSLAISADGAFVAATAVTGNEYDADTLVAVWRREGGDPVAALPLEDVWPESVALSPNGQVVAVTRRNPPMNPRIEPMGIDVIDVTTSALMFRILPAEEPNPPNTNCFSHLNGGLAFSPAGDRLAAGAQMIKGLGCAGAAVVEVWNLATGEKEQTLPGPARGSVTALAYSPDGTTLAVASRATQLPADVTYDLSLWDAATGGRLNTLNPPAGVAFSATHGLRYGPEGRILVGHGDGGGDDMFANGHVAIYGPPQ